MGDLAVVVFPWELLLMGGCVTASALYAGGGAVVVSGCWSGLFCIPGSAEVQSGDVLHLGPVECLYFPQQSDARLRTVV